MIQPDLAETKRRVLDEHRELLSSLRSVEAMTEGSGCATGDAARRIRKFAALWEAHIAYEEGSPLYTEASDPQLASLREQHAPFTAELHGLADATDHAETLEFSGTLATRLRKLVAGLRAHEAAEAEILQKLTAS